MKFNEIKGQKNHIKSSEKKVVDLMCWLYAFLVSHLICESKSKHESSALSVRFFFYIKMQNMYMRMRVYDNI